jgi:LAO/AO transport system kinase
MRKILPTVEALVAGILAGNRVLLAQAITLVESTRQEHIALAQEVIGQLAAHQEHLTPTLRIGITGAPGSGKSTFIEALGMHLVENGHKVAVLAIDPSSSLRPGSILGDKTLMERLSAQDRAVIRPSPAGDALGGVARKTRETIFLVEAAGYDTILIETVGVGQSEIAVHSMTDLFLLLLLPGAGDELQGIKRGIVEMADLLVVNKADGDRVPLANMARMHYLNALHLFPAKASAWVPQVLPCSAQNGEGILKVWETIMHYAQHTRENGFFDENRSQQALFWLKETLQTALMHRFYTHPDVKNLLQQLEPIVVAGKVSPFAAAEAILKVWDK